MRLRGPFALDVETESPDILWEFFELNEVFDWSKSAFQSYYANMENIGARRLHTIMTTLLEKPLFEHPKRGEKKIKVTAKMVKESLDGILEDQDLSRYIL